MKLQTDVSVQYALGEHKEALSLEDLEVDSPYNLYQNYGVGPGPYNSPSEDAIVAAMEPEKTDYFILPSRYSYKRNLLCENVRGTFRVKS